MARPAAWRAERRIAVRLGLVFFLFFALFHRGHFSGTDELGLYHMTRSLYEHGSLAVPDFVHTAEGVDGRRYSHFSVGHSALAVPFYALGSLASRGLPPAAREALAGPARELAAGGGSVEVFFVLLYPPAAGAALVALFFLFERRLGVSRRVAILCAAFFGASTYVATHATFFLRHVPECLTIVGALYCYFAWRQEGHGAALWLGSILASATLLVRLPASIAAPALGGYLAWCLYERSGRRWDAAVLTRALPAIVLPLGVALALSAASDWVRWGVPWNVNQLGTATAGSAPLARSLRGALLSPGMSIFVYSPLLVLAPLAYPTLWRRHRAEAVTFAALCLTFLLVFSSFIGWTGLYSAPGPRYQLIATPLLLLPLGLWLEERRSKAWWGAVALLAALGLFVQGVLMSVIWAELVDQMGWKAYAPRWEFLFVAADSPVAGAARYVFASPLPLDTWLLRLARGWPDHPPAPGTALAILSVWALLLAAAITSLARALARQPEETA
ncbi:MAG: phospholipid carrier-dependent glycosyltransferase [Myxococcota bacterium]|nr:phospholipid carrier-dependent glycosyltransferase [Myxococcota bacterium]